MDAANETPVTAETNPPRMRRGVALAITLAIACLSYAAIVFLAGDTVFVWTKAPPGREQRAALAIRDKVIPFYQWGTLLFTRAYLHRYYAASWYFTQAQKGDCKEAFVAAVSEALEKYPAVDLFLLAHTNKYVDWVEELPEAQRKHLRFVYNTGCHNQPQGEQWLALGAKTYIGHPGTSDSPFFYYHLLRHWTRGESLEDILPMGNQRMALKFKQVAFFSGGRFNAEEAIANSAAACMGNARLRIEDMGQ